MKKVFSILCVFALANIAFSDTKEILLKESGQACYSSEDSKYISTTYLSSDPDYSNFIFFEFDVSSLKNADISSAVIKFQWGADMYASSPAYVHINKLSIKGTLTGNAADDANANILDSSSTLLANIHNTTQDEVYSLDVSNYLKAEHLNSDFFGIAIGGYIMAPFINGVGAYTPSLTVVYTDLTVPEPSAYAVIMGIGAIIFIAIRRRNIKR